MQAQIPNPRSLAEHVGTGRHYGINSKRGKIQLLFSPESEVNEIYNTDVASFLYNEDVISRAPGEYVILVPSYMVFAQNYADLLDAHIASGADITLLYHKVTNADVAYMNCEYLKLDDEKTVLAIETNIGGKANKNIFMNSYIMKKDLFLDLIKEAKKKSSMYNLFNITSKPSQTSSPISELTLSLQIMRQQQACSQRNGRSTQERTMHARHSISRALL